jgi:hypothetical protein
MLLMNDKYKAVSGKKSGVSHLAWLSLTYSRSGGFDAQLRTINKFLQQHTANNMKQNKMWQAIPD